jgi:hypothetical protein
MSDTNLTRRAILSGARLLAAPIAAAAVPAIAVAARDRPVAPDSQLVALGDEAIIEADKEATWLLEEANNSPLDDDDPEYLAMCERIGELHKYVLTTPAETAAGLACQLRLYTKFATGETCHYEWDDLEGAGVMMAGTAERLAEAAS